MGIGGLGSRGGREVVGQGELSGARLGGGSVHGERRWHTGRRRACELANSFGTPLANRRGRGRGHSRADDMAWSAALHARRLARAHPRTARGPGPVRPRPRLGARGKGEAGSPRRPAVHHEAVEASVRRKDARTPRGRRSRSARTTRWARRRCRLLPFYST
jgi:hypothetical protein